MADSKEQILKWADGYKKMETYFAEHQAEITTFVESAYEIARDGKPRQVFDMVHGVYSLFFGSGKFTTTLFSSYMSMFSDAKDPKLAPIDQDVRERVADQLRTIKDSAWELQEYAQSLGNVTANKRHAIASAAAVLGDAWYHFCKDFPNFMDDVDEVVNSLNSGTTSAPTEDTATDTTASRRFRRR